MDYKKHELIKEGTYEAAILNALEKHGALGLMDLRRKVCGLVGHEAHIRAVKAETQRMIKARIINVDHVKNGFSFTINKGKK